MLRTHSELLTPTELSAIHDTSMKLLHTVGATFENDEAIAVFRRHGVRTDGHTVYLTEAQVMDAVAQVPSQFTLRGRGPGRDVVIGNSANGGTPAFAPGYGAPFIMDPLTGRRTPTLADYHNLVRLAHALPNQDLTGYLLVQPGDVPGDTAHLHMLSAHATHSDKPFLGCVDGVRGARDTMDLVAILFGEEKAALAARPVTMGVISSLSPLHYSGEMAEALMEYARRGQPVVVATLVMAGATGPITLAGMLAQQNAEILAGIVLAQLVNPGTPAVYGSTSTIMDMRTGTLAIGSPELSLAIVATAQLARRYRLPGRSGGALTDAHIADAQAGFESAFGLLTAITSGIDFILHAGGILSSYLAFSYEKFVLDDEICGMARRFRQGIVVTPETLAYDVITNAMPDGNFIESDHTLERCRDEFWQPDVCYRQGMDTWLAKGKLDAVQRAHRRWQELLDVQEDPPLDEITRRQLDTFIAKRGG